MKHTTLMALSCVAASAMLSGCASTNSIEPRLDERTGLTWTALGAPVAMAHQARNISTSTRDYLYVGPIEMNERGTRQEYLWLGLASTVPQAFSDELASAPQALLLEVDDFAFELPLSEWREPAPYDTAATVMQAATARISLDQIGLIAGADHVSVELLLEDGSSVRYDHWNGSWVDWVEFRDAVDPLAGAARSVARN